MTYRIKCNARDGELKKCFVACRKCWKTATMATSGATVEVAVKCWRGPHFLSAVLSGITPPPPPPPLLFSLNNKKKKSILYLINKK